MQINQIERVNKGKRETERKILWIKKTREDNYGSRYRKIKRVGIFPTYIGLGFLRNFKEGETQINQLPFRFFVIAQVTQL